MIDLEINGKILKEIDLIIFDKDGTLFESFPYWTVVARYVRKISVAQCMSVMNH